VDDRRPLVQVRADAADRRVQVQVQVQVQVRVRVRQR